VRREPKSTRRPRDARGDHTTRAGAFAEEATAALNESRFGLRALDEADLHRLFSVLRRLRVEADDFAD